MHGYANRRIDLERDEKRILLPTIEGLRNTLHVTQAMQLNASRLDGDLALSDGSAPAATEPSEANPPARPKRTAPTTVVCASAQTNRKTRRCCRHLRAREIGTHLGDR
jgi:hypothetical protein